jgi:D,D-heptose 1,7-bisphosphate phosphatase
MSASIRAVFLDKDGTLVEDVPYNVDPASLTLCSGVVEGLQLLQQEGYALIMVSNQPGIAKGHFDEEALSSLCHHLEDTLARHGITLQDFYYCPHHPEGKVARYAVDCNCRKPLPGMLLRASNEHGIDLSRSWMIGDILHDVEAGRRAGCKTVLIDNGNETEWEWSLLRSPDMIFPDMHAAARAVVLADIYAGSEEATPS